MAATNKYLNLSLLVLFPVSWIAPVMAYGIDKDWDLETQSILGGIPLLWESDKLLAAIVVALAIVAPIVKVSCTSLMQFNLLSKKYMSIANIASRLAFTDILLVALTILITKGIGVGHVESQWGLYLFSFSVALGYYTTQKEI